VCSRCAAAPRGRPDGATDVDRKPPCSGAEQVQALLGDRTCDVYLNGAAYWKNVSSRVWGYTLGGYQVIKKWLSYATIFVTSPAS
jgi:hypothetical protein